MPVPPWWAVNVSVSVSPSARGGVTFLCSSATFALSHGGLSGVRRSVEQKQLPFTACVSFLRPPASPCISELPFPVPLFDLFNSSSECHLALPPRLFSVIAFAKWSPSSLLPFIPQFVGTLSSNVSSQLVCHSVLSIHLSTSSGHQSLQMVFRVILASTVPLECLFLSYRYYFSDHFQSVSISKQMSIWWIALIELTRMWKCRMKQLEWPVLLWWTIVWSAFHHVSTSFNKDDSDQWR